MPRILLCLLLIVSASSRAQTQAPAGEPPVLDGPTLFVNSGCPQCHGPAGQGTAKAPSLRDIGKRKTDEGIKSQIKDGGKMMPPFGEALTDDQIAKLVEYLRSKDALKSRPSQAAKQ